MSTYLLVNLKAVGCAAHAAPIVHGMPGLFAYLGFTHALLRQAGHAPTGGERIMVLTGNCHSHAHQGQYTRRHLFPISRSGARDCADVPETTVDAPRSDMEVSLVVELATAPDLQLVRKELAGMRFSGGMITDYQAIADDDLETVLRFAWGLYIMAPSLVPAADNLIDEVVRLVSAPDAPSPWLRPTLVGYRLLEHPHERPGVALRSGEVYPHAYAEGLVGLVDFFPKRQILTLHDAAGLERFFANHHFAVYRKERIVWFFDHQGLVQTGPSTPLSSAFSEARANSLQEA